jgi:hypothetical protein
MARINGAPVHQGGPLRRLFVCLFYSLTRRRQNYRARFDHAFGIEGENFSEGAVCALPAPADA